MKFKCKVFYMLRGTIQPGCSCYGCWEYYFDNNEGKFNAARMALETLSERAVWEGQFKLHADTILEEKRKQFEEESDDKKAKLIKLTDADVEFITAQTNRYVIALKRNINRHKRSEQLKESAAAITVAYQKRMKQQHGIEQRKAS
jgi:hypothetical protein